MNTDNQWLGELSPDLFWDVRRDAVDVDKNRRWLVERVLTRGRLEDVRLIARHISYPALREVAPRLRIEPRERHFLEWILESHHA
jgi:hypothetical protein